MSDLHTRLKTVIEERLALAKEALPFYDDRGLAEELIAGGFDRELAVFAEDHDPADAIRRHEAALGTLDAHAPLTSGLFLPPLVRCAYEWGDGDGWPIGWSYCPEVQRLAASYGVDVEVPS